MNHFKESEFGYNKQEVNGFVDYVIKKTEENITIIQNQKEEIIRLTEQLNAYKKLDEHYNHLLEEAKKESELKKELASKEANLIINQAKDNANKIINDSLLQAQQLEQEKEELNRILRSYRKKLKEMLMQQLTMIDDVELL